MLQNIALLCVVAALLTSCWRSHAFPFSTTRHPVGVLSSNIPDHAFLNNCKVATPPCCLGRLSGSVSRRPHCASSSKEDLGDFPDQKKPRLTAEERLTDKDRELLLNSVDWVRKEVLSTRESQNAKELFQTIVSHINGKITLEEMLNRLKEVETSETEVEPLVEEKGGAGNEQPQGQNGEPSLSAQEFLLLVKDEVTKFKKWQVIVNKNVAETEEDLQQLIENSDVNSAEEIAVYQVKENRDLSGCTFNKPFTKKALMGTFLSDNRLKQVTEFLASTVENVLGAEKDEGDLVIPQLQDGVVETEGDLQEHLWFQPQRDKDYAIVVAGESGSGKTVLSCQIPAAEEFCCLYACIQDADLEDKVEPNEHTMAWGGHLQHIIDDFEAFFPDDKSIHTSGLYDLKTLFNRQRNMWARQVLENVVKKTLEDNAVCRSWWDGNGSGFNNDEKPDKLAIIIDEATDIDLANGLIDSIRSIYAKKRSLVRSNLRVILCGTGLDDVKRGGNVGGTNPEKSKVVIMKAFDPKSIGTNMNSVVLKAITEGTLSQVLSTNTRMFFRGVYPLMSMKAHQVDGGFDDPDIIKSRLASRLEEIGSFGAMMDYSVRMYLRSNTVSNWGRGRKKGLLDASFLHHLTSSLRASNVGDTQRKEFLQPLSDVKPEQQDERYWKMENGTFIADPEVFSRGLAMRDGSTSAALRYLSCAGLSCRVETGDGNAFEDLVRLHLTRLYSILGYTVFSCDLSNAWPPKSTKGSRDIGMEEIRALADDLSKASEPCLQKDVVMKELKEPKNTSTEKWCLLCRQGSTNAQGADLLVVRCDGVNGAVCVDAIQAKNRANVPKASECWRSLGIDATGCDGKPKIGSAGYSYQGLMSFIALLEREGFGTVALGKRVVALSQVSGESGKLLNAKMTNKVGGVAVWSREFLEPTFSSLQAATNCQKRATGVAKLTSDC